MPRKPRSVPCLGALGLTALLTSGCGSLKSDLENACNAVERSGVRKTMTDAQGRKISEEDVLSEAANWAIERARSEEGKNVWKALSAVNPRDKGSILRQAAKEAGVDGCPFADELDASIQKQAKPPPPPAEGQPAEPKP